LPKSEIKSLGANTSGDSDVLDGGDEVIGETNRPKGSNYHQRGHYFIFYEDGSQEH